MAKIIKGSATNKPKVHQALPDSSGVIHKRVSDAENQAGRIISEAKEKAARIKEEAEKILAETKTKRDEAVKKGYGEGEAKGLSLVTEKLIAIDALKEKFYDNAEPEIIKLVIAIAEKVIGDLSKQSSEVVKSVVHLALERAIGDRVTVRLNPEDYKNIMSGEHEFKDIMDRTKRLLFREDESISKGGCTVETEVGTIDARMETQLEAIRKALSDW